MFLFLSYCILVIFITGKRANHGAGKYGLEIPANVHFYGPEKAIKMTKNKIKIEENLNATVKHCLK